MHMQTKDKVHSLQQENEKQSNRDKRVIQDLESQNRELKYDIERVKKMAFDFEDRLEQQKAVKETLRQKALESEKCFN